MPNRKNRRGERTWEVRGGANIAGCKYLRRKNNLVLNRENALCALSTIIPLGFNFSWKEEGGACYCDLGTARENVNCGCSADFQVIAAKRTIGKGNEPHSLQDSFWGVVWGEGS